MAVVVQGFPNPILQVLQAMSVFYGIWVFVNIHAPQQKYCHSELSVETFRVLCCVLMQCFATNLQLFKTNNFLVNSHIACRILVLPIRK